MDTSALLAKIDLEDCRRLTVAALREHENGCGTLIAFEFADFAGLDDPENFNPRAMGEPPAEFIRFVHGRADQLIHEELYQMVNRIDGEGFIEVHRAMIVPPAWLEQVPDCRNLGLHWSWDKECAIAHNGSGDGIEIRMSGRVHESHVDWTRSIAFNAGDDYSTGTENEILLLAGYEVILDGVEWRQDIFDEFRPHQPALQMA